MATVKRSHGDPRSREGLLLRRLTSWLPCPIRSGNIPPRPSSDSRSPGRAWPDKWSRRPITARRAIEGSGRLAGRKALITGGDSGMGRAAAIAYAREGADVAINYFPTEEPDAQEVFDLIKAEGRKGRRASRRSARRGFCKKLVEEAVKGLGGLDIVVCNAGAPAEPRIDPGHLHRGFRRHHEDQHLRAVLDHQGGAAAPASRARRSSAPPPSRPTIPRRTSTTTPRPRRRR